MSDVRTFWCQETGRAWRRLRRFVCSTDARVACPGPFGYHNASVDLDAVDAPVGEYLSPISADVVPRDDARWPTHCACGYAFTPTDRWQIHGERIMRRMDTWEEFGLRDPPVGAVWNAWWEDWVCRRTADGRSLHVQTPGGAWPLDGRASNCTLVHDHAHFCWCRHGRPEDGNLHVDKIGNTCGAGGGSFATPAWHGFLHHGVLRSC